MATRINTRLILILVVSFFAAAGIIGGLWFLQMRGDATRLARIGDEFLAQRDYEKARDYYRRALGREPGNAVITVKLETAIRQYQPITTADAVLWYRDWLGVLRHRSIHFLQDHEAHLRFIDELHAVARRSNDPAFWTQLEAEAGELAGRVDPESDLQARFVRRQNMASMRLSQNVLTLDELEQHELQIEQSLNRLRDQDQSWADLLTARTIVYRRLLQEGRTTSAAEKLLQLIADIEQAEERVPGGLDTSRAIITCGEIIRFLDRNAYELHFQGHQAERVQRLLSIINGMDVPSWLMLDVARVLVSLPQFVDQSVITELLTQYLSEHPGELDVELLLSQQQYESRSFDTASAHARHILDSTQLTTSFLAVFQNRLKLQAGSLLGDISFLQWDSGNESVRAASLETLSSLREQMASLVSDASIEPLIIRLEGELAYIQGDHERAVSHFETLIQEHNVREIQTLILDASSLEQIKQFGLAHQRINEASLIQPGNLELLYTRARLEFLMGRHDEAQESLNDLFDLDPNHDSALELRQAIIVAGGAIESGFSNRIDVALRRSRDAFRVGNHDAARDILRLALETDPQSTRLIEQMINVEAEAGNLESAMLLLDQALERSPDSSVFQRLKAILTTDNPVQAMIRFAQYSHEEEPAQAEAIMTGLTLLMSRQQLRLIQAQTNGDEEQAREAQITLQNARQEAETYLARIEALDPENKAAFEYRFTRALLDENVSESERLLQQARELNFDLVGGLTYQARYEMTTEHFREAKRTLQQATELRDYSADLWQLLAIASQLSGDEEETRRAYGQAYRCNPTDLAIASRYANMLVSVGDKRRALTILQGAFNLAPSNVSIREQWLAIEKEEGVVAEVLKFRFRRYLVDPSDGLNKAALARLYGYLEPSRLMLLDDTGAERYTQLAWSQFSAVQQRDILDNYRAQWRTNSELLLTELETQGADPFPVVMLRAEIAQARGEYEPAVEMLERFMTDRTDVVKTVSMILRYSDFLVGINRSDRAVEVLREGLPLQDSQKLEIDAALAQLHMRRQEIESAITHFVRLLDVSEALSPRLQLVDCYLNIGDFPRAEALVHEMEREGAIDDFLRLMIQASLDLSKAKGHFERSEQEPAIQRLRSAREALTEAESLKPEDAKPHIQLARLYLTEFSYLGEPDILGTALQRLDNADEFNPTNGVSNQLRIEINLARGDIPAAINGLTALLRLQPENSRARLQLIQMRLNAGNTIEAVSLARDALLRTPNSPQWRQVLGDLLLTHRDDPEEASEEYRLAYMFSGDPEVLSKLLTALLNVENPDNQGIVDLVMEQPDSIRDFPDVKILQGRALHGLGRTEEALAEMRLAYQGYQELIEQNRFTSDRIIQWMTIAGALFPGDRPDEFEVFVKEVSGEQLGLFECRQLAAQYMAAPDAAWSDRALELQRSAVELCPDASIPLKVQLQMEYANYCILSGRFEEASETYAQIIELTPDNVMVLNNYAFLLADHLSRPEEALAHAQRAQEILPDHPDVLDTLGWVHYKLGDFERAAQYLALCIATRESASAYVHLAKLFLASGDLAGASERLIKAERLASNAETRDEIRRLKDDIERRRAQEG